MRCGAFFAAVSAVPVTGFYVVIVVANTIALELGNGTVRFLERRIQTLAFETVLHLLRVASFGTTVAAVPAAAAAVVIIIAETVTFVNR